MIKLNKKYQENYLLKGAILFYCAFLIAYFIIISPENVSKYPSRLNSIDSFRFFLFLSLIFAPIFEEYIFRYTFYKKNKYTLCVLSIIILNGYTFLIDFRYLVLSILYSILFFYSSKRENKSIKLIIILLSVLLFSIVHYDFTYIKNLAYIYPILAHISVGLALTWVVINFGIKTSIFLHFAYNLILIYPLFISIQFPSDTNYTKIIKKEYLIELKQVPVLNSNQTIKKIDAYTLEAFNIQPIILYDIYDKTSYLKEYKNKKLFAKYDIKIKITRGNNKNVDIQNIKYILKEAGLIEKIENINLN